MSMASKFGKSIVNMFTNDKKSNAAMQANAAAAELEASQETARKEALKLSKTCRFGFPFKPTCIAYDQVQHLIAIGTKNGYVKFFGAESVEYTIFHVSSLQSSSAPGSSPLPGQGSPSGNAPSSIGSPVTSNSYSLAFPSAVLFISFLTNEGALITYCDDSTLSFWNLRQKQPGLLYSKKLVNEKVTAMHLPFQSNWLYIGTEKGNTYILNVYNNFSQSGYDIKWNNVIELSQKTKPGKVVHISDYPLDSSKILIGFDSGLIVLWNIKLKRGELRFYGTAETMSSISWLYDGKQFMSSHNNGSLIIWNCKSDTKPVNILIPHMSETDLIPHYNMIKKVSWEANKSGEQLIIFSDGLPSADCSMKDAITIIRNNKIKTIIEMKERIIDFLIINSSPWVNCENPPDPSALLVLLENNLVIIDLKTDGYPQFQHHHPINIHESPVTSCQYIIEPNWTFFQNLLASKERHLQTQQSLQAQQTQQTGMVGGATTSTPFYSQLPYPVNGGIKCAKSNIFSYNELIATGHEDGSIKIWDTSGISLSLVHKLKTQKIFDKRRCESSSTMEIETPFRITALTMSNSYLACAAAGGHVTLYKFYPKTNNPADEELADIPLLEIPIHYEYNNQESKSPNEANSSSQQSPTSVANEATAKKDLKCFLRAKIGFRRQGGFQPELVCLLFWLQRSPVVNSIAIYSKANLILFGTDESIVCVDYVNRVILLNSSLVEFYGNQDHFHRGGQRSPKKNAKTNSSTDYDEPALTESHNSHFLTKQYTLDSSSFHQTSLRDTTSRSSSCSSLENLSLSEGVSFIAINENQSTIQNRSSEFQQQMAQIWLGTSYGSVIVLNSISYSTQNNSNSLNESLVNTEASTISISSTNTNIKPPVLNSTGTIFTLKGPILEIAFLDMNGNLQTPINSNINCSVVSTPNGNNKKSTNLSNNSELDLDFSFTPNAQILSNSIADNFYGSSSASSITTTSNLSTSNSTATQSHELSTSGIGVSSSSSPSSTPTVNSFVNPFTNAVAPLPPVEEFKLNKTNKKILASTKSSKGDFNTTQDIPERNQFVVICSETQIKVIALPTQTCIHKYMLTEGSIAKASVVVVNSLSYLSCCLTNGSYLVFNLPNLKPNLNISLSPILKEKEIIDRISKTFTFGIKGHALYMCSQSEIQKIYLSTSSGSSNLTEMLPELFDPKIVTPPAPKPSLFKSIFSVTPFDREELFGESSGKPSTSIVKNIESDVLRTKGELSELHKLALQRGEKLSTLQLKSEEMTQAASAYAKTAHDLANKYKKSSKWL